LIITTYFQFPFVAIAFSVLFCCHCYKLPQSLEETQHLINSRAQNKELPTKNQKRDVVAHVTAPIKKDVIYEPLENISLRDEDDGGDEGVGRADGRKRNILLIPAADGDGATSSMQQVMQVIGKRIIITVLLLK